MRERYIEKLKQLSGEVQDMGALCQQAIMGTCHLVISQKEKQTLITEVDRIEAEIDAKEGEVESICMQLLLRQQPVASDLRLISASLKIVTDMERIGDQATDIAEILETGSIHVPVKDVPVAEMAQFAMDMVSKSVLAYVMQDLQMAEEVIESDDELDSLFLKTREILHENTMGYTPEQVMDLLMIAKYYERIGDHASNICEWVEFSVNGFHRSGNEVYDLFGIRPGS